MTVFAAAPVSAAPLAPPPPPGAVSATPLTPPPPPGLGEANIGAAETGPAAGSTAGSRIIEIIPPARYGALGSPAAVALEQPTPGGANAQASAEPCVNVFVRAAQVDGRQVVSVDLHGDGLIKSALPPRLGSALLARAGSPAGADGARAACVSPALAQSLFHPVINVAGVDTAVKVARVGERWVLAGSHAPQPVVAKAQAPLQLAAARTRGTADEAAPKRATTSAQQDLRVAPSERRSMFASSVALLAGGIMVLLVRSSARRTGRKGSVTHALTT